MVFAFQALGAMTLPLWEQYGCDPSTYSRKALTIVLQSDSQALAAKKQNGAGKAKRQEDSSSSAPSILSPSERGLTALLDKKSLLAHGG
ncbi:MAG: hypothetical protein J5803_05175 [Desulfovibrio sp.]|nr:hypothetical protein [Desulfovibrio sp.]